ncbi:iron-containing alcohol dehydrogenase [Mangrovimicrobium sediminis]|uniref:Iron-containing alcohol dehydrogenase n=1 Tax=Mangrovimicrobium sediminis TaxID=2562682 RepID=A0A4Z0M222_9GAMM|nr:iron-containing alcohol dehydrogenase [Haliea sp. SAOS-164]TGD73484.1 iron-containing alcohol dehydrogenase [Haliea sp. SAOS-164]
MSIIYYKLRAFIVTWLLRLLPRKAPLVLQGSGSAQALARQSAMLGFQRLLLVSDRHLVATGLLEPIRAAFTEAGVEHVLFDGIDPDPDFDQVRAGEAILTEHQCDGVFAVGGGSVLDAAKMIALLHNNPGELAAFDGVQKARRPGLPLFAVPTTAGTGSEITLAAVITDKRSHRKVPVVDSRMIPDYVALDASLMRGMPPGVTAATGMDALSHAIEAYLSRAATPATERQSRAAVYLIFKHLARAWRNGEDLEAREAMASAAFFAGAAFSQASLGYTHGIGHQLGRVCHLPHGVANAMILPEVLAAYGDCVHPRLAELARTLDRGAANEDNATLAQRFIDAVVQLRDELQLPRQAESLSAADVDDIVREAQAETGNLYPVPRYLDADELRSLVRGLLPAD